MSFEILSGLNSFNEMPLTFESQNAESTEDSFSPFEANQHTPSQGTLKTKAEAYTFSKKESFTKESNPLRSSGHLSETGRLNQQSAVKITLVFHQVFVTHAKPALHTLLFPSQTSAKSEGNPTAGQKQVSLQEKQEGSHLSSLHATPSSISRSPILTSHKTHTTESAKTREKSESRPSSESGRAEGRQWSQRHTLSFWETRYHQREREKEKEGRQHHQQQGDEQEQKNKKQRDGIAISGTKKTLLAARDESSDKKTSPPKRPELDPPKVGIFALYYILTKMGISSDGASNFAYKKEIEKVELETTEAHKKRLDEMKVALEKEKAAARWGIALKIFSWIGSFIAMIAGVALIATGVGAVAGAMLITAGVIQVTSQLLEITGAWHKIAAILPGDNPERKKAIVMWMQMGIAVLCLILSGVSIIWGGYSSFGEAMQSAMSLIGGIAAVGQGVTTIGGGIMSFMYKDKISHVKRYELRLAQLKHLRQDLMEKVEGGVDRLEQLFEDLSRLLDFEVELSKADQSIYR